MTKLKKTIASLAACALMTSALTLNASAIIKFGDFGNGVKAYAELSITSTSATASTFINATGGSVSVSIVGHYYAKGTTSGEKVATNGGGGQTSAGATIRNDGGTWTSVKSTHSATDGKTRSPDCYLP